VEESSDACGADIFEQKKREGGAMRLPCPLCGERDSREFSCIGSAEYVDRPDPDADAAAWEDYLHLRDNPAGVGRDLWYHEAGCASWLVVTRNRATHEVLGAALARDIKVGA
jgi:sarcosine oxidase subunit delta